MKKEKGASKSAFFFQCVKQENALAVRKTDVSNTVVALFREENEI